MDGDGRRSRGATVAFRLSSPGLGYSVDVRLDDRGDRWLAVAEHRGRRDVALGMSPRTALAAALAPLGRKAVNVLLANPELFAVSCTVLEMRAAR